MIKKVIYSNMAIVFYQPINTGATWAQAKQYCESLGGHLATVTSSDEQSVLEEMMNKYGVKNSYWIGGYLSGTEWRWITSEDFLYSNWAAGQPDNYTGSENRLMVYFNKKPS